MDTSKSPPPEPVRFDDLPLTEEARAGLKALGYELATPVQAASLGPAMEGKDLLVQSKTGTGKTTAFGLPLVERMRVDANLIDPQAIVLCPTRELAIQVGEELAELGDPKGVRVLPIYGGTPMGPQLAGLKSGCDVIVGTPGRVLDHVRRRTLRLVHVHIAVLDEADEMLSMGFWDEVTAILDQLREERQTFLFSATLPDEIRRAASKYLRDPVRIDISKDELTVEGIRNIAYYRDDSLPKPRNLLYVLEVERPESAIVFCNTRQDAQVVASFLRRQGLHALAMSGDLGQKDRERIMKRMKRGEMQYLVATDIAARGIDISDLSHVILYSLPEFTEVYLHRVGRTGRIGKTGTAISLIGGREEFTLTQLKRDYGIKFEIKELPPKEEILRLQAQRVVNELVQKAQDVELTAFLPIAEHLRQVDGAQEAIALLVRQHFVQLEEAREREAREEEARRDREQEAKRRPRTEPAPVEIAEVSREPEKEEDDEDKKRKKHKKKRKKDESVEAPTDTQVLADHTRLFISRGASHGYDEQAIKNLLAEVVGQGDPKTFLRVQLRRTHAFIEVPEGVAELAVSASERGIERDEKPVTIERARTR